MTPPAAPGPKLDQTAGELTLRAVLSGLLIGSVLAVANTYMGLKTGWWDPGFISAAILGFALLTRFGRGRSTYSALENNITQTTSSSVASMPSTAGLLGAIPALGMLGKTTPAWVICAWGLALGALGALVALLLRRKLVVEERLPFPSGMATAEVIAAMHRHRREGVDKARALLGSFALAMVVCWLRDGWGWIAAATALPGRISGIPLASLTVSMSWSPLLIGSGVLVGPHIAVSILLGAGIAWMAVAPLVLRLGIVAEPGYDSLVSWLTWPGVGLMLAATAVSLLAQVPAVLRAGRDLRALVKRAGEGWERPSYGMLAVAATAIAGVLLVGWMGFGISVVAGLIAIALTLPLGALCARSAGETDVGPFAQVGQVTQVVTGPVTSGVPVANIGAASVVAGSAATTAQLMWCFRAGHDLDGSPRRQFWATLIGVIGGALLVGPTYSLLCRAYGLGSQSLPAPFASVWKTVGLVVTRGGSALPPHAARAALLAFVGGLALSAAGRTRWGRFVPSPLAIGVGFIMPSSFAIAMTIGAAGLFIAGRRWPAQTERYAPALGAGAVAGESVMGVIIAALIIAGVLSPR